MQWCSQNLGDYGFEGPTSRILRFLTRGRDDSKLSLAIVRVSKKMLKGSLTSLWEKPGRKIYIFRNLTRDDSLCAGLPPDPNYRVLSFTMRRHAYHVEPGPWVHAKVATGGSQRASDTSRPCVSTLYGIRVDGLNPARTSSGTTVRPRMHYRGARLPENGLNPAPFDDLVSGQTIKSRRLL